MTQRLQSRWQHEDLDRLVFYTVSEFIQYTEGRGAKYRDTLVATQFGCSNYFDRGVDSVSTLIGRCFTQAQSLLNTPGVSRGAYYRNALAATECHCSSYLCV